MSGLSGIITLGFGDSMASIIGKKIGSYRWPDSNKTLEGSIAFWFFVAVSFFLFARQLENGTVRKNILIWTLIL